MAAVDQAQLLRFLKRGEEMSKSPVVQAVYYGLAERVRRGEFSAEDQA